MRIIEDLGDKQVVADLRAEYDLLRLVDDPRVPKPLGFFAGQGALALAQRPGISLKVLLLALRDELLPMSPASALDLALEIAHAVRAMHAILLEGGQRISHGHLTSERVWLTLDGEVQVLGFGARLETPAPCLPPEARVGGPGSVAGDQWQQAAMLFEMVTLEPLFQEGHRPDVSERLSKLDTAYPALARTLHRALAQRPEDRYTLDREWIRALHGLLRDGGGVSERRELVAKLRAARAARARARATSPNPAASAKRDSTLGVQAREWVEKARMAPGVRLTPLAAELPVPADLAKDWKVFEPPLEDELLPLDPVQLAEMKPDLRASTGIESEPIRARSRTELASMVALASLTVAVVLMLIRMML